MAESTLTYTLADLKAEIGAYLGVSRTSSDWTAENLADIVRVLKSGQRQFYEPYFIPAPGAPPKVHIWSFLRARLSLSISNGTNNYDLPDDFAGFLDEELAFLTTKNWPLKLVPMKFFLEKYQLNQGAMPSGESQPMIGAVESKTSTLGTTGQRWTIYLWPTPASSLTLTGQYRLNPAALATDGHYPLGGEAHSQTLLESCLSAAEEFLNDSSTLHRDRFQELLASSIALDSRLHAQEAA